MTEAELQEAVTALARMLGWRCCHVRRSIGKRRTWTTATSVIGWPDLVLWSGRHGRVLYRELKSDAGKLTAEQEDVLASLRAAGADADVWRSADLDERIPRELGARRPLCRPDGHGADATGGAD